MRGSNAAATVDLEADSGQEPGLVGTQEQRRVRDVARCAETAKRHRGDELLSALRRILAQKQVQHARFTRHRVECADAN